MKYYISRSTIDSLRGSGVLLYIKRWENMTDSPKTRVAASVSRSGECHRLQPFLRLLPFAEFKLTFWLTVSFLATVLSSCILFFVHISLFWRDFEDLSPYLAPGSVGPEVERLHQLLARAGTYNGNPSAVYDRATTEATARFQRSRRLIPDGIVGPLTKIVLYDALTGYAHPSLSGDT